MSKLFKAFMGLAALMALSALLPGSALAAKATVTHPTGTTAPVPLNIIATNVNPSTKTHSVAVLTNEAGEPLTECTTATLTGTLTKNTHAAIEGNITSADFKGTPGVTPHTTHCKSTFGAITVTTNPATNGLPWCMRATEAMAADEIQIRGNECAKAARPIRFVLDVIGTECVYERTTPVVAKYTTHPSQAQVTVTKQEFPRVSGSFICPTKGFLDMTMWLYAETTAGTEQPLYIDPVA